MKYGIVIIAIFIALSFSSCSKKIEIIEILPTSIKFVNEDGSSIINSQCINPNNNYAILIETNSEGIGERQTLNINYTVNGILYNMTFTKSGSQKQSISLKEGENIAVIINSSLSLRSTITCSVQGDFEIVE